MVFCIYFKTVLIFQEKWRLVTLTLLLSDLEAPHKSVSLANLVFPRVGPKLTFCREVRLRWGEMHAGAGLAASVLSHFESAQTRLCEISVGLLENRRW